jgi:Co/Zn/Cd efflux system component
MLARTTSRIFRSSAESGSAESGADCCAGKDLEVDALAAQARIRPVLILGINAVMFVTEFTAGLRIGSSALIADSVDMLGDASVYALSLYALNRSLRWKAGVSLAKGVLVFGFGAWIAVDVVRTILDSSVPSAGSMGIFGVLALAANLVCFALLWQFRSHDINMSSTFECSRNDVISNVGVILAAVATG